MLNQRNFLFGIFYLAGNYCVHTKGLQETMQGFQNLSTPKTFLFNSIFHKLFLVPSHISKLSVLQFTWITSNKHYWNVPENALFTIWSVVALFLKDGTKD